MKNSNNTNRKRSRDISAWSAVLQHKPRAHILKQ